MHESNWKKLKTSEYESHSTTISIDHVDRESVVGLRLELRIRLAESVEEMRTRFEEFVAQNPELNVEQEPSGEIVILSPTGAEGSSTNSEIVRQLGNWAVANGGKTFDSSAIFIFANGAKRAPDAAWIAAKRWDTVSVEDRKSSRILLPTLLSNCDLRPTAWGHCKRRFKNTSAMACGSGG